MRKLTRTALLCIMLATAAVQATAQKWENLAETPQMGWNSWNKFQGNISEEVIKGIADAMVEEGLLEAGYTYLNIDDCWHGKRDADGFIQVDAKKFPSGMKALADYVHSKGLKMGIYSDAGTETCGGYPGSLGHEYQDAIQYSRWGIDYLKYDWCNTPNINPKGAYTLISDALRAAGRPILLSMCEWGNSHPGSRRGSLMAHHARHLVRLRLSACIPRLHPVRRDAMHQFQRLSASVCRTRPLERPRHAGGGQRND